MENQYYQLLSDQSLAGQVLNQATCHDILTNQDIELLPLLTAAFVVRKHHRGMNVTVHIINNVQNGHCPENCRYCAQAKTSDADIEDYGLKSDEEIMAEAEQAAKAGAFRYCMVFAGRGPSPTRIKRLSQLIRDIKSKHGLQVCVSAGLLNQEAAKELKEAGLDRLNHNLNTSERYYPEICTSHTFVDRIETLQAAKANNLEICSGMIVGMGEQHQDIIDVAMRLREFNTQSIPVNFLVPIEGAELNIPNYLTPNFCLRVLALFRFLNPTAEIRMAAGREGHLRSMEVLGLYAADSLFLDGYLNTRGSSRLKTLQMIKDAGFNIMSDEVNLDELLALEDPKQLFRTSVGDNQSIMKDLNDLRPAMSRKANR